MSAQQQSLGSDGGGVASPSGKSPTSLVITVNRVKSLLKSEPEVKSISTEACFAVAKATELFVGELAGRAAAKMRAAGRDSLEYADVAAAVAESEALDWLADLVPQTVKAAALLDAMQQTQQQQQQQAQQQQGQQAVPAAAQ